MRRCTAACVNVSKRVGYRDTLRSRRLFSFLDTRAQSTSGPSRMPGECHNIITESVVRSCDACGEAYDRTGFSNAQWKGKGKAGRRCILCIAGSEEMQPAAKEGDCAWLTCSCGQVEFNLPCRSVLRFECCCCDCRKGHELCHAKGGPAPPPVPDLVYYPNALMVERGHEHLRCFTIQEGFPTRRVVATCCWTAMVADHPAYAGKRFVAYQGPATLKCTGIEVNGRSPLRAPDGRIFQSDMSAAELAALPPLRESATKRSWAQATTAAEAALEAMQKRNMSLWQLVTVQELIKGIPSGVQVADAAHVGPTPFSMKQGQ